MAVMTMPMMMMTMAMPVVPVMAVTSTMPTVAAMPTVTVTASESLNSGWPRKRWSTPEQRSWP